MKRMPRLNLDDTRNLEGRIQELKNSISGVSEERWHAALAKDERAILKARIKASEKTLENCDAIASYLNHFSPPLSNEVRMREKNARTSLERISGTNNPVVFHNWIKNDLIPPTKMAERLVHLAASSIRKAQGEDLEFHKWARPR